MYIRSLKDLFTNRCIICDEKSGMQDIRSYWRL